VRKSPLSREVDLLKLSKDILRKGKSIRFQARGWSMRPFIQDGDFITISPVENFSLKVGNVVLYSASGNRIIVHRIIRKYKKEGKITFFIKGDAAFGSPDRVDAQNVLGKVTAVERKGRRRSYDTKFNRLIGWFAASLSPFSPWIYPAGSILKRWGRRLGGVILEKLQGLKIYNILVNKLIKNEVRYQIASSNEVDSLNQLHRYNRRAGSGETEDVLNEYFQTTQDADFLIIAKRNKRIIGSLILAKFPESDYPYAGWWVFDLRVNRRYRGIGIGERLVRMAIEKVAKHNASDIKLLAFEDEKRARNLYQKLDFRQISIPELDKQLKEEAKKSSRRRVILAKNLKSG
jgi:ribosomal protein S18 acetylase RimI-like enzyme